MKRRRQHFKIAVPLFQERVSPHFGASRHLLLMEIQGTEVIRETLLDIEGEAPVDLIRRLVNFGVDALVCGGIQRYYKEWLRKKGIAILDNQKGFARELVRELVKLEQCPRGGSDYEG